MKRNIIIFAAMAVSMAVSAQNSPFGIGIYSPNAHLHVHESQPVPLPPIFAPGDRTFADNYETSVLITNFNTGTSPSDGLLFNLYNYRATIKLQEKGVLIFANRNYNVYMAYSGQFGIGDTAGNYKFYVSGTSGFSGNVTMNGSLSVGSGFKCDAQGNMKVKHLKVTLTDWPDYVFGRDYALMPLGELEAYIERNCHLPGVPSAQEVESDGADIGEMNRVLMEKVEELTLYIIDLQKQIDELKSNK